MLAIIVFGIPLIMVIKESKSKERNRNKRLTEIQKRLAEKESQTTNEKE